MPVLTVGEQFLGASHSKCAGLVNAGGKQLRNRKAAGIYRAPRFPELLWQSLRQPRQRFYQIVVNNHGCKQY
jgi:hypothetical protein